MRLPSAAERRLSGGGRMLARTAPKLANAAHQLDEKARYGLRRVVDGASPRLKAWRWRRALLESGQLVMGRHSYVPPVVVAYPGETNRVVVGAFCSLDSEVRIFVGGNHRPDWATTYALRVTFGLPGASADGCPASKGDVIIGNDVWIGSRATVLSGVHIGNGAVVGASALVTRDVPPYTIVAGNPARKIRRRFSDEHIAMLEEIAWWDWPLERIIEHVALLSSPDIDALYSAHLAARTTP